MKTSINTIVGLSAIACLTTTTTAFTPTIAFTPTTNPTTTTTTQRNMFGGTGKGLAIDDGMDEEKTAQDTQIAAAMGMSLEEYQLGMQARMKMEQDISDIRASGGDPAKGVTVERDGNSPPKHLIVTVTDVGKALGKVALEKELVSALAGATEASKKGREDAQKGMMQYIAEQMKGM
mmetsp:Transcript_17547/g.20941  ORF Transcript_17547/g.20941 Transcript_17547/m.20941 type:complete len:177 (-) Transcript_17547:303-833(-)|eukprot:CAMPEP_0198261922 /NCGR_PEP_ID=MMETSP1447-20131203/10528_1 /TAXON_ID=420782 /ORGANISM="Chaetoceros dichaeta, Strain CCMP1751" /LENGTH=176 /DNA_ID=CAMNT_0043949981 /DNA_START=96 /DNA_END=626 /DNA_ORIENTATION=+